MPEQCLFVSKGDKNRTVKKKKYRSLKTTTGQNIVPV